MIDENSPEVKITLDVMALIRGLIHTPRAIGRYRMRPETLLQFGGVSLNCA
jgi:hypothetical protein